MARLRLFARAREAAGRARDEIDAETLGELLEVAALRYGDDFVTVLERSRVWVNGDEPRVAEATPLQPDDEVAVLPPVSGGAACWTEDPNRGRRGRTLRSGFGPSSIRGRRRGGAPPTPPRSPRNSRAASW